jgi:2-dehydro-3-deoxy-D-gluconate 5-dehydrogenase
MFDLTGKVAVVTGGSRGIGAALAVGLAERGAEVLIVSRTAPKADVVEALDSCGHRWAHHAADLSRIENVPPVIQSVVETFGRLDILVNNAGIIRRTSFLEHTVEDWREVLETNLTVPVFLAQAAARQMVKQGNGGKIINVCSMLSFQGGMNVIGYTASKHGLAGATKLMANELAKHGINVNGLAPGYIETDNTQALRDDEARFKSISARIPRGRWGTPDDLVGAAVFLASRASDYMNGHILCVDGGWMSS